MSEDAPIGRQHNLYMTAVAAQRCTCTDGACTAHSPPSEQHARAVSCARSRCAPPYSKHNVGTETAATPQEKPQETWAPKLPSDRPLGPPAQGGLRMPQVARTLANICCMAYGTPICTNAGASQHRDLQPTRGRCRFTMSWLCFNPYPAARGVSASSKRSKPHRGTGAWECTRLAELL